MRIIGFNFEKIQIQRKEITKGNIKITNNLNILSIEKDKVDIAGEILKFSYNYEIKYEPDFANLEFKGEVLVLPEEENIKEIQKEWKKKKIKNEIRIPIFNYIMSKCNLKALQLEEDFNLPPHIPLPRLTKQALQQAEAKGQEANYTG